MGEDSITFNCSIESEEYISFDAALGELGIDIFNKDEEDESVMVNSGVVLSKDDVKNLVSFLQSQLVHLR